MAMERLLPRTLQQALALCATFRDNAKIIAGGTDLTVQIKKKTLVPEVLISLEKVRELNFIAYDKMAGINLGAATTVADIEKSGLIRNNIPILSMAAATLGNPLVRRTATIGGNLCNASPSADLAPPLLALEAQVVFANAAGERAACIEAFFVGPKQTILVPGDLVTRIVIPKPAPFSAGVYLKNTRSRGADLAQVGVAVVVALDGDIIGDVRIALGAVAPTPIRARSLEDSIRGRSYDDRLISDLCQVGASEACCISDVRCSAEQRDRLIGILVKRAIGIAVNQINKETTRVE